MTRSRRRTPRTRAAIGIGAVLALIVGCSVDEPRNGTVAAIGARGESVSGPERLDAGTDDAEREVGGAIAPDGTSDAIAPGGSSPRRAAGGGRTGAPDSPDSGGPPATSGSVQGNRTGVSADTIAITVSGIFSGPYGPVLDGIFEGGFGTWADEVNEAGGIHGRKVVFKKVDNAGTSDGAVAACKQAQSNGTFATFIFTGGNVEADCLQDASIPAFHNFAPAVNPAWTHVFALVETPRAGSALASFVKTQLPVENQKVGVIFSDDPMFAAAKDRFVSAAREEGLDVAVVQGVAQNQATFVSELLRMRDAGVTTVGLFVFTEVVGILRDARSIGYQPQFTGAGWVIDEFSQPSRNLMDGIKAVRPFHTADSPAYARFAELARKYGRSQAPSTSQMAAYGQAQILGLALATAGPDPTRESLVAGMRTIDGYQNDINPPMSWSSGQLGSTAQFPVVCCRDDNNWRSLGAPRSRF